jgi:hypothetical protein
MVPITANPVRRYTFGEVCLKFCDEKVKDIAKTFGYGSFWVAQAIPHAPIELKHFGTTMGEFKNFVSFTEIPKKTKELWEAAANWWANAGQDSTLRNVFKKGTSLTNSVVDSVDLSSRYVGIDAATMSTLKGINFAATCGGGVNGALEQAQNLYSKVEGETLKAAFYGINFLRDLTYGVFGGYGIYCIYTATPLIPWVMVGLLSTGLALTILGYFVEKLYDPERKGKNLNQEDLIRLYQRTR